MKKLTLICLFLLLFAACAPEQEVNTKPAVVELVEDKGIIPITPKEAIESTDIPVRTDVNLVELSKRVRPAVVLIKTFDNDNNPIGLGSGFFINDMGHLVTNRHIIEGAYSATAKSMSGDVHLIEGVLAADVYSDVVKLVVKIERGNTPFVELTKTLPSVGEDILVVGNPFGLESTVSKGIVSAVREIPTVGDILQISAPISQGSSGSPVLNMKGQVIGVATFIIEEGQALNFAIPADKIQKLQNYANLIPFSNYEMQKEKDIFERAKENLSARQKSLLEKANTGDSDAMCQIGKMYLQGIGDFSKNEREALKWLKLAADIENTEAMYELSKLYLQNNFIEQDPNVGFNWLKKASEKDHIKSTLILSWIYKKEKEGGQFENFDFIISLDFDFDSINRLRKLDFPKSQKAPETLFKKASSLLAAISEKDCKALNLGALFYRRREIFGQSNDEVRANKLTRKVAECYEAEAEAGNYEAMYEIGRMYLWGTGVTQDSEIALKWLLKSAEAGNPEAIEYLGWVYETGTYVEINIEKATEWYKRTAEIWPSNGHAMYRLGSLYEKAEEIEQDYGQALNWYTKAANVGNVAAMISIGDTYRLGKGITEDSTKAVEWYKRALEAEESNTYAMVKIADIYSTNQSREADAISWYEKAAELNSSEAMLRLCKLYFDKSSTTIKPPPGSVLDDPNATKASDRKALYWAQKLAEKPYQWQAQLCLAYFYYKGIGTEKDDSKALEWFNKAHSNTTSLLFRALEDSENIISNSQVIELVELAAYAEVPNAMRYMAMVYALGLGEVEQDEKKAFHWHMKAANAGEVVSMFMVGFYYEGGFGVEKDYIKAIEWYRKAAEAGDADGMVKLALAYKKAEDYANAVKWFQEAAEKGNTEGMFYLALAYNNGEGVTKDSTKAFEWYLKAAQGGNSAPMYNLALMYSKGEGVIQDHKKAFEWFNKAAQVGDPKAMTSLGQLYLKGEGVVKDNAKALEWFRNAAAADNPRGLYILGTMYEIGQVVTRDYWQAVGFYKRSARLGYEPAKERLVKLDETW